MSASASATNYKSERIFIPIGEIVPSSSYFVVVVVVSGIFLFAILILGNEKSF